MDSIVDPKNKVYGFFQCTVIYKRRLDLLFLFCLFIISQFAYGESQFGYWDLELSFNKDVYEMSEPITMTLSLRNRSDEMRRATFDMSLMNGNLRYDVISDRLGMISYSGIQLTRQEGYEKYLRVYEIGPGEVVSSTENLLDYYQLNFPGKYTIQAVYHQYSVDTLRKYNKPNSIPESLRSKKVVIGVVDSNKVFDRREGKERFVGYKVDDHCVLFYYGYKDPNGIVPTLIEELGEYSSEIEPQTEVDYDGDLGVLVEDEKEYKYYRLHEYYGLNKRRVNKDEGKYVLYKDSKGIIQMILEGKIDERERRLQKKYEK